MSKMRLDPNEMSFLDHLEDLRWHILRSFIAIFIVGIGAFIFKDFIFDKISFAKLHPSGSLGKKLTTTV